MSTRRTLAALASACAVFLLVPVTAGATSSRTSTRAATPASSFTNVPVAGRTASGRKFTGTYTVDRFVSRQGKTYAVGTLTGRVGHRTVTRHDVAAPVSVEGATGGARDAALGCPVLHLVLGPLNLNLLGLHVHLNQVVLDITAVPGAGNLLGNLLCSVANLLNGGGLPISQVTGLLNVVQQLVNNPGLLNL